MPSTADIQLVHRFRDYALPFDVDGALKLLLRYVPGEYLAGLRNIVLTNSTSSRELRRGKTLSRGRKVRMVECNGFYRGDHIELLLDNLFRGAPRWVMRWPPGRTI